MTSAVSAYASYASGEDRDLLGRFVLPVTRLDEFDEAARNQPVETWKLSVVVADELEQAFNRINEFNSRGRATVDTIETPAHSVDDVTDAATLLGGFDVFVEVPLASDPVEYIEAISENGLFAKMRTGGITEAAFPAANNVVRFMERCVALRVPFKATAGLHHLVRGPYRLTYDTDAPTGTMFGYLNIFVAAAFVCDGDATSAEEVLRATDASEFRFSERGLEWRDRVIGWRTLSDVRGRVALSFGSCSFDEPVDEARAASLI
jgi:hypothetical protein